jgi:hypothetical protein
MFRTSLYVRLEVLKVNCGDGIYACGSLKHIRLVYHVFH